MFVTVAHAAMTASNAAIAASRYMNPRAARHTPIVADAASSSSPRRLTFTSPAVSPPARPPAASDDTAKPNAAGDPNRVFAMYASPTLIRSEEHTSELQSLRHLVCR